MKDDSLAAFYALLGIEAAAVTLSRLDVRDWGQTLVLAGTAGDTAFELRDTDCRELRWRVYVTNPADETPLVSFASGRDQQRSPAQFLTAHFGLSLFYGSLEVIKHLMQRSTTLIRHVTASSGTYRSLSVTFFAPIRTSSYPSFRHRKA